MDLNRPETDETQAIACLRQGDLSGLELLVQLYQVKAMYAAYLIVRERTLAEDVVQAAFLRAYERIGQYDGSRPFGPWFLRSVVNAAIDASKQLERYVSLDEQPDIPPSLDWLVRADPCPEDFVETEEMRRAVRRALDQLPPEQRAAIVLRHFLEMREGEMTSYLGRPASTIKWRLHEARRRLRDLLRPLWQIRPGGKREEE